MLCVEKIVCFSTHFWFFRKLEVLEKTADEISTQTGNPVIPLAADVRDAAAVSAAIDQFIDRTGGLPSIVINNAAGNFISPTERLSANAVKTVIDIVLNGTFNVTLDIGKRLIKAKQGEPIDPLPFFSLPDPPVRLLAGEINVFLECICVFFSFNQFTSGILYFFQSPSH